MITTNVSDQKCTILNKGCYSNALLFVYQKQNKTTPIASTGGLDCGGFNAIHVAHQLEKQ